MKFPWERKRNYLVELFETRWKSVGISSSRERVQKPVTPPHCNLVFSELEKKGKPKGLKNRNWPRPLPEQAGARERKL